jgi:FkbM family methyltransferase
MFVEKIGVRKTLRDLRLMGPQFAFRQLRPKRDNKWAVTVPGYPQVYLRPDTTDAAIIRCILGDKEYSLAGTRFERVSRHHYDEIVASGKRPLIIDAGANIGAASLWFAHEYPKAIIVAIEPEPGNAACLRENTAGADNIIIREAALGATAGKVALTNPANHDWAFRSERSTDGLGIDIVTIPQIIGEVEDAAPFLAKIDIEGFESDLFAQNTEWISAFGVLMIEIHDWMFPGRGSSHSLQRAMAPLGYDLLLRGENLVYVKAPKAGG